MKKSEWKHIARTQSTLSKKLLKKLKSSKDWNIEREKLLELEEANSRRLANHLSKIAHFLNIEWDAEDFPIMEVFYAIKQTELAKEHKEGFIKHLDTIANFVGVDWQEGHFPIDEVIEAINKK